MDATPAPKWEQSLFTQLRELAERSLRGETPGHSLQPTLLVNEAYLYLEQQRNLDGANRTVVLAAASRFIRRYLVDCARRRKANKRGGPVGRGIALHVSIPDAANALDLVDLNDALDALSQQSERAAKVVELRFFGGLTGQEIADHLGNSLRTINNDWEFAKAWLRRELKAS